eukprot:696187-Pleurochrysis_carterae.AAC.1
MDPLPPTSHNGPPSPRPSSHNGHPTHALPRRQRARITDRPRPHRRVAAATTAPCAREEPH